MINEVWYRNGERYVHSSFEYVTTGFLIDTGTDTLAATVKHSLWVAKTKAMNTVDLRHLQRWIMHPKGVLKDSVVIDYLINTDTTEVLNGNESTITQRDWLVFKTRFRSPAIQPLKPRYTRIEVGETIYFTGCPYSEKSCVTHEARVIETEGNRIIFTRPENLNLGGFSGSPLIDKDGYLIGILGGSSFDRKRGEPALYGISNRYLQDVLRHKKPLNVPLIPIDIITTSVISRKGLKAGVKDLRERMAVDSLHYRYDFSMEKLNSAGDYFIEQKKPKWAIELYKVSAEQFRATAPYLKLANAYILAGKRKWPGKPIARFLHGGPTTKKRPRDCVNLNDTTNVSPITNNHQKCFKRFRM
ncbi:S1 family peptidase [Chryseolinea lacunae]|uniref:Trypsin-like peptidase domain-containing protein n=1 Tax=Chryseolinea lacunae TaxID=2801331 RepID=A0ABS1L407_9BACT|nr:serine protease [Chryseolinea lacunae]MBL0745672.1 trypsin-like peptidase domain-containing protein [Chryseolinea lacunae]